MPSITIVHKELIGPAWWRVTATAPEIATRLTPGQFLLVRCADPLTAYLRRPLFPIPHPDGLISWLLRPTIDPGLAWLLGCKVGDSLDVLGPLGQGFPHVGSVNHICLLSDHSAINPLLGQMGQAVQAGVAVTLALGGSQAKNIYPKDRLPTQVELQIATLDGSMGHRGSLIELLPALLRWADVLYATGSHSFLRQVQQHSETARLRLEPQFLYGLVRSPLLPCGVGSCLSCHLPTSAGPKLICADGPVFDLGITQLIAAPDRNR